MRRDKEKDSTHVNCTKESELQYISRLYPDSKKVYCYLKQGVKNKTIPNYERKYLFILIRSVLGYEIPI